MYTTEHNSPGTPAARLNRLSEWWHAKHPENMFRSDITFEEELMAYVEELEAKLEKK